MNKLAIIHDLARNAGYNEEVKAQYKKLAMSVFRTIAKDLNLDKSTYDLRWNAGGIAVAGDVTLHHEKFYLTSSESGIMWRTCNGRKDYTGGRNQWAIGFGESMTIDQLVLAIQSHLVPNAQWNQMIAQ